MKTVHIVYGPPLAGKSTFFRKNMGPDDLVFDMDAVQNALCYGADHAGKPHTLGAAIITRFKTLLITAYHKTASGAL